MTGNNYPRFGKDLESTCLLLSLLSLREIKGAKENRGKKCSIENGLIATEIFLYLFYLLSVSYAIIKYNPRAE